MNISVTDFNPSWIIVIWHVKILTSPENFPQNRSNTFDQNFIISFSQHPTIAREQISAFAIDEQLETDRISKAWFLE